MLKHTHINFSGHYMYIESSAPRRAGQKARLISKSYPASNAECLSFWYHMYGTNIGTLNVYTMSFNRLSSAAWSLSGNQGNQWKRAQVTLQSQNQFYVSPSISVLDLKYFIYSFIIRKPILRHLYFHIISPSIFFHPFF